MDRQKSKKPRRSKTQCTISSDVPTGNQHPFLNPLIVEKVLGFCKVNHQHDKYLSLRLVSKLWDTVCSKTLRRETQIPVPRLLEPYPAGLGWTLNRYHHNTASKYYYKCPLPTTREFENFQFTATCESFKDRRVHRLFSVMGEQVKSLHFVSSLACFHQNDLLANILHKWCPNLESLHLDGIQCFSSLIYIFETKLHEFSSYKNSAIICRNLKNLTISVESDSGFQYCRHKIGQLTDLVYRNSILVRQAIEGDLKAIIGLLPERSISLRPEVSSLFYQLIDSASPDADIFTNIVKKYPNIYGIDSGFLGRILKTAPLQKLVINELVDASQTQDLIIFLLCQPSKLRSTLEHLEFRNASLCRFGLKALSLLKCPLSTLRIDKIVWRLNAADYLQDILRNSSETLTNFEIGLEIIIYDANNQMLVKCFQMPRLPKLKFFTNKTIGLLNFEGLELFRNAPNLEQCTILNLRCEGNGAVQKHFTARALQRFCANLDDTSIKSHPLKILKIKFGIESHHVNLLRRGLPNLANVEMKILNHLDLLLKYPKISGWESLDSVALSIGKELDLKSLKYISNDDMVKCFDKLKEVKFFEMTSLPAKKNYLPASTFTHGFAKLTELRSLKISNVNVLTDNQEEIRNSVKHIPFVLFSKVKYITMKEFIERVKSQKP